MILLLYRFILKVPSYQYWRNMNQRRDLTIYRYKRRCTQITADTFLRIRIRVGNFSWRRIFVEPLMGQVKNTFKIDPLQIRGSQKAAWIVLLSALLYQIIVCHNCKTPKGRPKAIKHTLGS
jgi:hypothetical protein